MKQADEIARAHTRSSRSQSLDLLYAHSAMSVSNQSSISTSLQDVVEHSSMTT